MPPEADQQHRDQQDCDRRADAEIEGDEPAQPMREPVVAAPLPHEAKELDRRAKLGGPADEARNQDVQREEAANCDLRADDVAALRGVRGQLAGEPVKSGSDDSQRIHRLKSRPEPSKVRMTTNSTANAPGTITAGRSNGLRSGPRSMNGRARRSRTPPVGRTRTRGISCCGTRRSSSSSGRKNHSGTGV